MIQKSGIRPLLQKFLRDECDEKELAQVIAYFQETQQAGELPSAEEVKELLGELSGMDAETKARVYEKITKNTRKLNVQKRKRIWRYANIAAVFIGVLAVGYFYLEGAFDFTDKNILVPANEAITLELEDGTIEVLDPTANKAVLNNQGKVVANQSESELRYDINTAEVLVHNTLAVPYGKRFDLVLSDGTIVYMNSGTKLKYPVSFLSKGNREVFVEGEAYFDVTSDSERPFIVNAEKLNVKVLGTEFNVLAYPEDGVTDVVLVQGSVGMYADDSEEQNNTVLTPGLKGSFDKDNAEILTEQVNTTVYTAWRTGELVYRNLPFKNIVKKLERHYNVNIELNNIALGEESLNASFKEKTIEDVLGYFDELYGIEYTIENNQVFIK